MTEALVDNALLDAITKLKKPLGTELFFSTPKSLRNMFYDASYIMTPADRIAHKPGVTLGMTP